MTDYDEDIKSLRSELNKTGKRKLDEFIEGVNELTLNDKRLAVTSKAQELLREHPLTPIRFMNYKDYAEFKSCPRFPECKTYTLDTIDRNTSLLIFVSHCWMRGSRDAEGWETRHHPDNAAGDKHRLCVNGIKLLKEQFAPGMKDCFIWYDYACMNQDNKDLSDDLEQYDKIVECCDTIFTPLVDHIEMIEGESITGGLFGKFKAKLWNEGPTAYLNRAWCRVEMFYASVIPPMGEKTYIEERAAKFTAGLAAHFSQGRRAHALYGTREDKEKFIRFLPSLQYFYFDEFHPLKGVLSVESDRKYIVSLIQALQRYAKPPAGYVGEKNEQGQYHGRGTLINEDGSIYDGEWRNGLQEGQGIFKYVDGGVYVGQWVADFACGYGEMDFAEGATYKGEWKEDARDGHGWMRFATGNVYEGEWRNDASCGAGVMKYANGDTYEGQWKDDLPEGKGIMRWANGNVYEGDWKNGSRHGHGVLTMPGNVVCDVDWVEGRIEGRGLMKYANGGVYEGELVDSARSGQGVMTYPEGGVYRGEWSDNHKHGQGVYDNGQGEVYEGEWRQGLKCGRGKMTMISDAVGLDEEGAEVVLYDVYEGEFVNDWMDGRGVMKYADGTAYDGEWRRSNSEGRGVMTTPEGFVYEGEWKDGSFHGLGRLACDDGRVYEGQWCCDVLVNGGSEEVLVHFGVGCDGCEMRPLIGPRHKSLDSDFDLCLECYKSQKDSLELTMVKITCDQLAHRLIMEYETEHGRVVQDWPRAVLEEAEVEEADDG